MKTVLIVGGAAPPPELREIIARGSTALEERRAGEMDRLTPDALDRLVFWTSGPDPEMARIAQQFARRERTVGKEMVVFVASDSAALADVAALAPNECYVWPRDEDRLKMAFLTGG